MSEPIKFPDMRPRTPVKIIEPPPPADFRRRIPDFQTSDATPANRRFERKRLYKWLLVAVALHAALLLGLYLMPTLRIKWEPSPDAWVPVFSVPKDTPPKPVTPAPVTHPKLVTPPAVHTGAKGRPVPQRRDELPAHSP